MNAKDQADTDAANEAVALLMAKHPYRALHRTLPILLATSHPSIRRFAWKLVESLVVRMEKYNLPSQRHVDSFTRIYRRYRDEAEALGDSEVVALLERGIAGVHIYNPATDKLQTGLSVARVTATLEGSETEYVQLLALHALGGREYLDDAFAFIQTTPIPTAREAALTLIEPLVARLEARSGSVSSLQRQHRLPLFTRWRAELANDPEAAALCDRAIAALEPASPEN